MRGIYDRRVEASATRDVLSLIIKGVLDVMFEVLLLCDIDVCVYV